MALPLMQFFDHLFSNGTNSTEYLDEDQTFVEDVCEIIPQGPCSIAKGVNKYIGDFFFNIFNYTVGVGIGQETVSGWNQTDHTDTTNLSDYIPDPNIITSLLGLNQTEPTNIINESILNQTDPLDPNQNDIIADPTVNNTEAEILEPAPCQRVVVLPSEEPVGPPVQVSMYCDKVLTGYLSYLLFTPFPCCLNRAHTINYTSSQAHRELISWLTWREQPSDPCHVAVVMTTILHSRPWRFVAYGSAAKFSLQHTIYGIEPVVDVLEIMAQTFVLLDTLVNLLFDQSRIWMMVLVETLWYHIFASYVIPAVVMYHFTMMAKTYFRKLGLLKGWTISLEDGCTLVCCFVFMGYISKPIDDMCMPV